MPAGAGAGPGAMLPRYPKRFFPLKRTRGIDHNRESQTIRRLSAVSVRRVWFTNRNGCGRGLEDAGVLIQRREQHDGQ